MKKWFWCFGLFITFSPIMANYKCNLSFDPTNIQWVGDGTAFGYDAFAATTRPQEFKIPVTQNGGDECAFILTISSGESGDYNKREMEALGTTDKLGYQFYRDGNLSEVIKDPKATGVTHQNYLQGKFSKSNKNRPRRLDVKGYLYLPPLQVVKPGQYKDKVKLRLYSMTETNHTQIDQKVSKKLINVAAEVLKTFDFSLGNAPAYTPGQREVSIDFGPLPDQTTTWKIVYLTIRANTNMKVKVFSGGQNRLAHEDTEHHTSSHRLDFRTLWNGQVINGVQQIKIPWQPSQPTQSFRIGIEIPAVKLISKRAGKYTGYVTLEFEPE